jgi:hypothetical protein
MSSLRHSETIDNQLLRLEGVQLDVVVALRRLEVFASAAKGRVGVLLSARNLRLYRKRCSIIRFLPSHSNVLLIQS